MTTLSTTAGTVAHDSHGSGDPIVLLPSGGHEQHDYDEIRGLLPGRFRSIGVDWPGHGLSPAGPAPSTGLRLTRIVEELLDSLTPAGVVPVANSVGGNVAARLAIRRPELVRGLMIIDGGGFEGSRLPGRVFCALMSRPGLPAASILPAHDLRGQAGDITAPTVLIWGRRDPVLPLRAAETARDLIPGSRLVVDANGRANDPHFSSPATKEEQP
jgi:pimeloyl-ACP methyl ester carboxylesterase